MCPDYRRRIDTHVDIGGYIQQDGLELWIQGSESLLINIEYCLFLRVTFLDSWATLYSGMLTFRSDFGQGKHTVVSMSPSTQPPMVWILRRIFLFPLYISGILQDTLEHNVLLSNTVRYDRNMAPFSDHPIEPVRDKHVHFIVHVQVDVQRHLPDVVAVSAWYQASNIYWSSVPIWYLWYLWYFGLSFTTITAIFLYVTYSTSHFICRTVRR